MNKVYLTVKQLPKYRQITFEDMLAGMTDGKSYILWNKTGTITRRVNASDKLREKRDISMMELRLKYFCDNFKWLIESDLHTHYNTFYIPKKSGGLRKICAPDKELSQALRDLKSLFEEFMPATYHTSAYAYIENRSTIDERGPHQRHESQWYSYFDFHDFFGSTTSKFVMDMLKATYPFNFIIEDGYEDILRAALSLAFLDGGLPQGTPFSPLITNIMMIPFDHTMTMMLREFSNPRARNGSDHFIYTRYADDLCVSCRNEFDVELIQKLILDTLEHFGAPFSLNTKKTKYQSRSGKNFHLGVIINKDNNITLGHQKKRRIKAMVCNYMMDKKNGKDWPLHDVQILNGQLAYFHKIEPESQKNMLAHFSEKFGKSVEEAIHNDLVSKSQDDSSDWE